MFEQQIKLLQNCVTLQTTNQMSDYFKTTNEMNEPYCFAKHICWVSALIK